MKKISKILSLTLACTMVAALLAGCSSSSSSQGGLLSGLGGNKNTDSEVKTSVAMKGNLSSEISSSGTIQAKNTYNITALVSGEIIEADFEEGDLVEEGQVLYKIDSSSMESELKSANNSLERSATSYEDAVEDYEEALEKYANNCYRSTRSGYIKKLNIQVGDSVGSNTQIAEIYNDKQMKIRIPFLSGEAACIGVGNEGTLTLADTLEQISGKVTAVANMDETLEGGILVRYVTMQVTNPGGLTSDLSASAQIGPYYSAGTGTFEASTDSMMQAELSTQVKVESLLVSEGDWVSEGTPIFRMTEDTGEKLIKSYKDAMEQAEENSESAQQRLDSTQDTYDEYTITAPISGKVITKTYKVGDKISQSQGSQAVLAIVYDMSEYTFEMSVDELDVLKVEAGQSVRVEADAFEDETYEGTVTNVSLVSSSQNGVSTYPVTVTLKDTYDLLPGMNVDGYIILGESNDAIIVPSDAVMRGNQVYVQDDTVKEQVGTVPAGFRAVEVEIGLTNEDYVEILSGINEGDVVYVPESSSTDMFGMPGGMGGGMPGGGQGGGGGMPSGGGGGGGMPGGGGPG